MSRVYSLVDAFGTASPQCIFYCFTILCSCLIETVSSSADAVHGAYTLMRFAQCFATASRVTFQHGG